jgi:membrane fusion protein (multidrug efflux system)
VILLQFSCKSHTEENHRQNKFLVTTPIRRDTTIAREYVCQIRSIRHIEIRSQVTGFLQETYVDEGQLAIEGKPLFKIMPNLYAAEYEKAKAEAEYAQIKYTTTKMLADSTVVSPQELALAKAELEKSKAALLRAETHLNFTDIRAPFTGLVGRLMTRKGSLLEDGEILTTLSDNSEMWVYFNVPEAEYLDYMKQSQGGSFEVELIMANNERFKYPGVVKVIEAEFNNETGNVAYRASFPNPERLLRHGETGKVVKTIYLKNALLIPQKATFEILDKKYVFVVDERNVLHSRRINILSELPDLYVVSGGLIDNEKILLEGLRMVKDGDHIDFEIQKPEQVLNNLKLHAE